MSKCKEAYEFCFGVTWDEGSPHCNDWQAAWNARGKVDAEIAREFHTKLIRDDTVLALVEAIEQENEE